MCVRERERAIENVYMRARIEMYEYIRVRI